MITATNLALALGIAATAAATPTATAFPIPSPGDPAPPRLEDTGLYADPATLTLAAGILPFSPQYPLWSDGATKRRWIHLPPGTAIDASDADAWDFPAGTRLWKEFSFGRRVETRYMARRADGTWMYATYVWSADGRRADLAPERGVRGAAELRAGVSHDIPGLEDCTACHGAGPTPVLGFSALQLSPDRDPLAPHAEAPPQGAVDLASLVRRGLVAGLAPELLREPPRIRASTPAARAALGYLHGNCAGCHDGRGELASLGLDLTQRIVPSAGAGPAASAVGVRSRYRPPDAAGPLPRVAPGAPDRSTLAYRIARRDAAARMPPIGSHLVDEDAVALVRRWIAELQPLGDRAPARVARAATQPTK